MFPILEIAPIVSNDTAEEDGHTDPLPRIHMRSKNNDGEPGSDQTLFKFPSFTEPEIDIHVILKTQRWRNLFDRFVSSLRGDSGNETKDADDESTTAHLSDDESCNSQGNSIGPLQPEHKEPLVEGVEYKEASEGFPILQMTQPRASIHRVNSKSKEGITKELNCLQCSLNHASDNLDNLEEDFQLELQAIAHELEVAFDSFDEGEETKASCSNPDNFKVYSTEESWRNTRRSQGHSNENR